MTSRKVERDYQGEIPQLEAKMKSLEEKLQSILRENKTLERLTELSASKQEAP
jgi:hypothetical protein